MSELTHFRKQKDEFFRVDPHSPLTVEQREEFEGLEYFPVNDKLRFELDVHEPETQDAVQIQTNTGEIQTYTRLGQVRFEVEGREAQLTIFENQHGYFLPFADSLAGKDTYGAGRYLEPQELPDGKLLIDFNLAYNPYCAYNENWSCPLTPPENRLDVPIRAGEKVFANDR